MDMDMDMDTRYIWNIERNEFESINIHDAATFPRIISQVNVFVYICKYMSVYMHK